jgi:hypothetical protein
MTDTIARAAKPPKAKPGGAKPPGVHASDAAADRVPAGVAAELSALTGLSARQVDAVLQLISLPENGTPEWWKQYGYIEFLGDGRGYTCTLYGACSGTGDLAMILDALAGIQPRSAECDRLLTFRDAVKKKRGDDVRGIRGIKGIIQGLGADPAWREAVWRVYVDLYWKFAAAWADKTGPAARRPGPRLTIPAVRGFVVDCAINSGADTESLMAIVKRMPARARNCQDEIKWFKAFAEARRQMLKAGVDNLDTSKTGMRATLWSNLVDTNPSLATPFRAYKGYWGDYTIS